MGCDELPEMVFIEDILASLGGLEKALALVKSKLPTGLIKKLCGKNDLKSPAVILFTSGSEKDPKVVQLTQQNLLSNINSFSDMMDVRSMDNLLAVLPFFHVFGLTINLWTPLCLGMTSIAYANPLDFKTIAQIIKEYKPQLLVGTPLFLEGYARQSAPGDFASVELTVTGADKCPKVSESCIAKSTTSKSSKDMARPRLHRSFLSTERQQSPRQHRCSHPGHRGEDRGDRNG